MCGLANDLSWAEERLAVALANYMPHLIDGVTQTARLGTSWVVSCPDEDPSTSEAKEEQEEGEEEE